MKIFIAHSTADHCLIEEDIKPILRQYFYKVEDSIIILDRFESYGKHWEQVRIGIESCDVFIVLVSENSKKSEIVLNETELALKRKENIIILPILINTEQYDVFYLLLNQFNPPFYNSKNKNTKSIEDHIENLTCRRKKGNSNSFLDKKPITPELKPTLYQQIENIISLKILFVLAILIAGSITGYFIFFQNSKKMEVNDYIIINQIPIKDSLGGDEKLDTIGGKVNIKSPENYRIVIYAYTNMWYIQPSIEQPLIEIKGEEWKTATHLGEKYAVILVKKEFDPQITIAEMPKTGNDILEIKIIP